MGERFVLLGLAPARAEWFRTVGRWATAAMLPAEFLRCVSVEEVRARLRSGRAFSAVLIDGQLPGVDRDLIEEAQAAGVSVLVVDGAGRRDWRALGAAAVLAEVFSRDELVEVLQATSRSIGSATAEAGAAPALGPVREGRLLAVCGPGGTGASTVAIALAQGMAGDAVAEHASGQAGGHASGQAGGRGGGAQAHPPSVILADLCRVADQALLHDARTLVPSVQELVEAHRSSVPAADLVLDQTFEVPERGYRLLLGLRRARHWVSLRPRAVESALDSLQSLAEVVVADVEADVEGEEETGSRDVEDRNLLSRAALARAELVLVVGEPSMKGVHALVRTIDELVGFGVPVDRVLPVVNRAPRSPRRRAEVTAAVASLAEGGLGAVVSARLANPLHLPERPVDQALRDGVALPSGLGRSLTRAVSALAARLPERRGDEGSATEPVAITPGSLAAFTEEDEA